MAGPRPDRGPPSRGACSCGRDLAVAADLGLSRSSQQEEIPAAAAQPCSTTCTSPGAPADSCMPRPPGARADAALSISPRCVPWRFTCRLPACPGVAVPAADRRRHRRCRLRLVRPFLPGEVVVPGRGVVAADPRPDHRRCRGVVRRDDAAVLACREKKYVHGAFTEQYSAFWLAPAACTPWPTPDPARLRRDRGLRPLPELLPPQVGAHRSEPGVSGSHSARLPVLRRELPGRHLAVQAQRALRGMIHAWHAACEQCLPAIPADLLEPLPGDWFPAGRRSRSWSLSVACRTGARGGLLRQAATDGDGQCGGVRPGCVTLRALRVPLRGWQRGPG